MNWAFLVGAGFLEIAWAISLQKTGGFQHLNWLGVNIVIGLLGSIFLGLAVRSLPLAVAYPIWKGLAILGIFAWEIYWGGKAISLYQITFALMILGGIVGIKVTS